MLDICAGMTNSSSSLEWILKKLQQYLFCASKIPWLFLISWNFLTFFKCNKILRLFQFSRNSRSAGHPVDSTGTSRVLNQEMGSFAWPVFCTNSLTTFTAAYTVSWETVSSAIIVRRSQTGALLMVHSTTNLDERMVYRHIFKAISILFPLSL